MIQNIWKIQICPSFSQHQHVEMSSSNIENVPRNVLTVTTGLVFVLAIADSVKIVKSIPVSAQRQFQVVSIHNLSYFLPKYTRFSSRRQHESGASDSICPFHKSQVVSIWVWNVIIWIVWYVCNYCVLTLLRPTFFGSLKPPPLKMGVMGGRFKNWVGTSYLTKIDARHEDLQLSDT